MHQNVPPDIKRCKKDLVWLCLASDYEWLLHLRGPTSPSGIHQHKSIQHCLLIPSRGFAERHSGIHIEIKNLSQNVFITSVSVKQWNSWNPTSGISSIYVLLVGDNHQGRVIMRHPPAHPAPGARWGCLDCYNASGRTQTPTPKSLEST